mmetsp:Transcript_24246/g.36364  ORF Transcript_24246/g.36364 Transcript_24246/m.36364 type:complete len:305 (-) Transcript_24246:163-1077(-)|eukprot:CAMPEP_0167740578 /NCGR_PEP_ID=MMETSP0110_2-20121227/361_1 /TAXON_ID=629695 /ORGANISM="Gymnochlora sp., Strain CCMP2014" /LENGTH=304 /DNA_ID=CAMNT_0007624499 /DNA_START=305 /DNA_END=1219 /DNA_ORIENTATION=-
MLVYTYSLVFSLVLSQVKASERVSFPSRYQFHEGVGSATRDAGENSKIRIQTYNESSELVEVAYWLKFSSVNCENATDLSTKVKDILVAVTELSSREISSVGICGSVIVEGTLLFPQSEKIVANNFAHEFTKNATKILKGSVISDYGPPNEYSASLLFHDNNNNNVGVDPLLLAVVTSIGFLSLCAMVFIIRRLCCSRFLRRRRLRHLRLREGSNNQTPAHQERRETRRSIEKIEEVDVVDDLEEEKSTPRFSTIDLSGAMAMKDMKIVVHAETPRSLMLDPPSVRSLMTPSGLGTMKTITHEL